MKSYIHIIIAGVFMSISWQTWGQNIIVKNDTIPIISDSVYLTIPGNYRGTVTWQQSPDNQEWHSLNSTTGDSLYVHSFFDSYYRAKIEEGTCIDIYSDTVKVIKDKNVITIQNDSLFEYAYRDSVGEVVKFILGKDTLLCEKINGEYYYQGDIIINPEQIIDTTGLKGAGIPLETRLWPNRKVYYHNPNMKGDKRIIDAIKYFEEKTSLRFYELDKTTIVNHNNFIEFVSDPEICSSPVGMQKKAQEIKIAGWAITGNVIHEIGHAVGLFHEQSRSDRINYIIVHKKNILPGKETNFDEQPNTINIPSSAFDFESIMLYPSNAFAIDVNKPTITKKDNTKFFAQRSYLSKFDILTIESLYPPEKPTLLTIYPKDITSSSVFCGGSIVDDGGALVSEKGLCWSFHAFPTLADNYKNIENSTNIFSTFINGLKTGTKYYIRAFATNKIGTAYGNVMEFTTKVALPEVTTGSVSEKTFQSATIIGNFTTEGGATITFRGVCWNTSENPTINDSKTTNGTGAGSFSSNLAGLQPGTTYYVRAYATISDGTAYGNQISFTTLQIITNPTLTTSAITAITQITATSGGNVTSDGGATVTARGVCWNTTGNPTIANDKTVDGTGTGTWMSELTELQPGTTYYVRAYAANSIGTGYGNQIQFTTSAATAPLVSTLYASDLTQNTALLNGNVTSDGSLLITRRGFYWCLGDNEPTANDNEEIVEGTTGNFSKQLTGLTAGTTYSFKAFASNNVGLSTGVTNLFATDAPIQVDIPVLTAPSNFSVFNRNNTTSINIQWDAVDGANEYWLNVFPSGQAEASVFNESVGNNTSENISINNLQNGVYIFHVRARATGGEWSNYSNAREFIADTPPTAPNLTAPINEASITQNTQQNFSWEAPSTDINRYYLRIVSGTDLNATPVYEGEPTSISQNINCNWPAGTYTWNVRGIKNTPDGYSGTVYENTISWGDYATPRTFTITEAITIPTVITTSITDITQTTATSGGNVTASGGATITARGICWSTSQNPTTSNSKTTNGTGTGSFTSSLVDLTANTPYYVRAYATNSEGTAYGNQLVFTTLEEVSGEWPRDTETAVVDVTNPSTGKTWMDRNLGASRAATSSTDSEAYGDLYQWGRAADGHQKRNSPTTSSLSTSDTPGHGNFILSGSSANYDWRSPQNTNLWQGINGINNPCPSGYRLPTIAELDVEHQSWSSNNDAGAFASPLKLPMAGNRSSSGLLYGVGYYGNYWSSTPVDGDGSLYLYFGSSGAFMGSYGRASGNSVRCLKDIETTISLPSLNTTSISNITQTSAIGGGNITSDGGATVTARGVCWNTTGNPTTANSKTTNGTGIGSWVSELTGLQSNTTYYVRAYATNNLGTAYGEQVSFTTLEESGNIEYGSFTDSRDGHTYQTVVIGSQTWMAENLAYLPSVSPTSQGSATAPYYYVYGYWGTDVATAKQHANYTTYGVLYNWPAATNACPSGWHLPSAAEWTTLEDYLIENGYNYDGTTTGNKIAKSLATATGWNSNTNVGAVGNSDYPEKQNNTGFTALPGGYRAFFQNFDEISLSGGWWGATDNYTDSAWGWHITYNYSSFFQSNHNKECGYSVRCLKY